jgi:hypothetical protein
MAFRSALFNRFGRCGNDRPTLNRCINAASELLRAYNRKFLRFHLNTLAALTAGDGYIIVVFDTTKRFDDELLETQFSFPPGSPLGDTSRNGNLCTLRPAAALLGVASQASLSVLYCPLSDGPPCTMSPEWAPRVSERLRVISIIMSGVLLLKPYTHSGKFSGS